MEKKAYWLTMDDQQKIFIQKWYQPNKQPKAVIQISHGMGEHIERYDTFARFFVNHGFVVFGSDHRGHGKTGVNQGLMGYFSDEDGFDRVVSDLVAITNHIKEMFPNTPVFMFGHSMGSFLARRYIQLYSNQVDGVILAGTGSQPRALTKMAKVLAKWEIQRHGKTGTSTLLQKLATGSNNKKIKNAETKYDWLTRDKGQIKKYIEDEQSGFLPTTTFYYDLFHGLDIIHTPQLISNVNGELPILIISGDQDPVGKYAIGVKKVIQQYQRHGIKQVDSKIYKDARHELHNEVNKEEVFEDILAWINKSVTTKN